MADDQAVTSASASSAEGSWDTLKFILSTATAGGLLYDAYPVDSGSSICSRRGACGRPALLRGLSRLMMSQ
jgi:hypothetical protein